MFPCLYDVNSTVNTYCLYVFPVSIMSMVFVISLVFVVSIISMVFGTYDQCDFHCLFCKCIYILYIYGLYCSFCLHGAHIALDLCGLYDFWYLYEVLGLTNKHSNKVLYDVYDETP